MVGTALQKAGQTATVSVPVPSPWTEPALITGLPFAEVFVFLEFKPMDSGIDYYGYERH